ncbi:hypothetical protein QRX25_10660 [Bacillus sp. L381]|uniref:hypothetical protein n=1 Tax=Bacillus TaxID=1386 RepID=UPI001BAA0BE6|nr:MULTISPECIES: hypothetical protein [Bacillus]MCR9040901.1 hypothetical protein [Bacillus velezensis]MEC3841514.1 hypothetical protein [Bacillus amyloliquefaciens]QUN08012.1 hypothetical protein KEF49_10510 [Bacillus amyloliquefaciens]QYM81078.1 hypothetical protein KTJ85_10360 [Bacillus sp. 7D3]QZY10227.1 hypothetical protein K7B13_10595 [Bacillus amyloliquefaciens]
MIVDKPQFDDSLLKYGTPISVITEGNRVWAGLITLNNGSNLLISCLPKKQTLAMKTVTETVHISDVLSGKTKIELLVPKEDEK